MDIFNLIGLIGTFLYLFSYYLLTNKKIEYGKKFILMNLFAACFVTVSLLVYWNLASFIVQIAWIIISLTGYLKIINEEKINE